MANDEAVQKRKSPLQKMHLALIFFCFIAGFLGAGISLSIGVVRPSHTVVTKNQQKIIAAEGEVIASTYKKVVPSVVSVTTQAVASNGFQRTVLEGAGTGIVISGDGYVITNKHVVQDTRNISVVTNDGTVYPDVEYIGSDPSNDLAFIKINKTGQNFTPAALADSSKVDVGLKVIAIGNVLGQYQNSVTSGIVSGIGRPIIAGDGQNDEQLDNLFQTDAAINQGNSGGPLLNFNGEVIGINTAVAQDAQGIGFAIPINAAKGLIKTLLAHNEVKKAYLGVRYIALTPQVAKTFELEQAQGAYAYSSNGNSVVAGSPADKAGLQDKDIITKVDEKNVDQKNGLALLLATYVPGDKVVLTIYRDSAVKTIAVTLGEYTSP